MPIRLANESVCKFGNLEVEKRRGTMNVKTEYTRRAKMKNRNMDNKLVSKKFFFIDFILA